MKPVLPKSNGSGEEREQTEGEAWMACPCYNCFCHCNCCYSCCNLSNEHEGEAERLLHNLLLAPNQFQHLQTSDHAVAAAGIAAAGVAAAGVAAAAGIAAAGVAAASVAAAGFASAAVAAAAAGVAAAAAAVAAAGIAVAADLQAVRSLV